MPRLISGRGWGGLSRRAVLHAGGLTALGSGMTDLLAMREASAEGAVSLQDGAAKSCILVWLDGGPSHIDTFDLKPQAPQEVRGPFLPIQTAVPGIEIGGLLPRTAERISDVAIIRSMTSPLGEHNFGAHYLLTGYRPTPVLEYACYGSVVTHVRQQRRETSDSVLPGNIAVPNFRVGGGKLSGNGFLPSPCQPFSLGREGSRTGDPSQPGFHVRDLEFYPGLSATRIRRRRDFLDALDAMSRQTDSAPPQNDPRFEQAYRMITSRDAREAFDIAAESPETRNRYGRRTIGQSCLLARRLVERGVPFVTVNDHGWDTHKDMYTRLKEGYTGARTPVGLIPSLDLAVSGLIDDLKDRGLFEQTLIVVMGEFGRTPKLNTSGGRDHWPRVFSLAMAGGGIPGGQVIGSSDAVGESPETRPVTPADLAATIYTRLGINPDAELQTDDGRPVKIVSDGTAVPELIG